MNILHVCLVSFYNDNFNYQENLLSQINKKDGHNVKIIASVEEFKGGVGLECGKSGRYYSNEGIEIVRESYCRKFPLFLVRKIRLYEQTYNEIAVFKPDVIFLHGFQMGEMKRIIKYKKQHPEVVIYADAHSDRYNSGKNILSRLILHRLYYKHVIKKALPYIEKIFYLTIEVKKFLLQMYQIPDNKLEFYPLGGIVFNRETIQKNREEIREELQLDDNTVIFIHAGKMDVNKRTKELLNAFVRLNETNCCLLILGRFENSYRKDVLPIISKDSRIKYLGWKSGDELLSYLCASDIYVQPGTQSATMQNALCCGCAVILADYPAHRHLLGEKAIYASKEEELFMQMQYLLKHKEVIKEKQTLCYDFAKDKLDYRKLAKRIY